MELQISKEALLGGLGPTVAVVESKQTMPILGHVHLRTDDDTLWLTTSDLEVEIEAEVKAETVDSGEATVPARKFSDIVRSLPDGVNIGIATEGETVQVQAGRGRYTLAGLNAGEFPRLETNGEEQTLALPQQGLKALLEKTSFAMARDDVRYYLNGVLLEWGQEKIRAVATDGHRLALMDYPAASGVEDLSVILPRKGIQGLERLLDDTEDPVQLAFSGNHIRLTFPGIQFKSKLIEGRFPDYRRVIPEMTEKPVQVDRRGIQQVLKRIAVLSNRKTHGVRLNASAASLQLTAENPDQEQGTEELEVEYGGDPLEIGFNIDYLQQAMGAMNCEKAIIYLWDSQSSCLILPEEGRTPLYVIMPMRL